MDKATLSVSLLALAAAGVLVVMAIPAKGDSLPIGSTGRKLSFTDLLVLAQNAGFSGNDAVTAAAIALAESSGDPMAYNPEIAAGAPQGQGSFGLWQIYLHMHPEFFNHNLYDPATNAEAAFKVFEQAGNSFSPWSTFNSQAYLRNVPTEFSV